MPDGRIVHTGAVRPAGSWMLVGCATAALVLTSAACGPAGSGTEDDPVPLWTLSSETELILGEQDGDPAYLFERIAGVRLLPGGGVAVADRGYLSVRVYDAAGRLEASMGGEGEGPGEFRWLQYLGLLEPDTLLVYDGDLGRITRFRTDGDLLETRAIRTQVGRPEVYLGTFSNGDAAISWIAEAGGSETEAFADRMPVGRFSTDGELVGRLGETYGMRRMGRGPIPFSPSMHGFLVRDSLVHTDGLTASLSVVGPEGTESRRIDVDVPEVSVTRAWDALAAALVERDQREVLDGLPAAAQAEAIPAVAEVFLDSSERFWLKHYDPVVDSHLLGGWLGASGGEWSVVDRDGALIALVQVPSGFIPLDERAGLLAGVVRDDLGVERVVVRRITPTN